MGIVQHSAVLAEEPIRAEMLGVKSIQERICILGQTGREDHQFVVLAQSFQELLAAGPHVNVNDKLLALYADRKLDVILNLRVEATVDQRLI